MSLTFHGITSNVPIWREDSGDTALSAYYLIADAGGNYATLGAGSVTFTAVTSTASGTWSSNYPLALGNLNDSNGASAHYYTNQTVWGTDITDEGVYTIYIVDADDIDASILTSLEVYWDGTTLYSLDRRINIDTANLPKVGSSYDITNVGTDTHAGEMARVRLTDI